MNYAKYHEQTLTAYKNVRYGGNSIYNSACGPATLANALMVLGVADITVKDACAFAVSCKARVEGGTDMHKLLAAAAKKWKITYTTTSSNAKLAAHLKAGGVAAMNQGSKYKVFSNGGHFVLAAAIDSKDRVTVIDSYWNAKKYKTWPAYHAKSEVLSHCFVRTPLAWCGKATVDRSPSYYLISKVTQKSDAKKEVEDMTEAEVRKIIADEAAKQARLTVSDWAKSVWTDAVAAKLLDDDRPQSPITRQEFAAELKKLNFTGRAAEPSGWAKAAWDAVEQAGIMSGDPRAYVTREMLAQVLVNAGVVAGVKDKK